MKGSASAPPFSTWEAARDRAAFLAACTGRVHRVQSVPPSPEWPWHRWRVTVTGSFVGARQALRSAAVQAALAGEVGRHVPAILL